MTRIWGDPRSNQVGVSFYGSSAGKKVQGGELRFGPFVLRKAGLRTKQVTEPDGWNNPNDYVVSDDDKMHRLFSHRCGLIKAVNVISSSGAMFMFYVEGFTNFTIDANRTEFRFDPAHGGDPVVELLFSGYCTRFGKIQYRDDEKATMIFRDSAQMQQFIVATAAPDTNRRGSSSRSSASEDDMSMWPLAIGIGAEIAMSSSGE